MTVIGTQQETVKSLLEDAADLTELLGTWKNTNKDSDSLAKLIVERDKDGGYCLQTFGVGERTLIDWGRVFMDVHAGERHQLGFHASYDFGDTLIHLAGNLKLGILVVQLFMSRPQEKEMPPYIEREFLCLEQPIKTRVAAAPVLIEEKVPIDLAAYAGIWHSNTATATGLKKIHLTKHLLNGEPIWHFEFYTHERKFRSETITTFMDNMAYPSFKLVYELSDHELILAANMQVELIVLNVFQRFRDSPEKNRAQRQIFIRRP